MTGELKLEPALAPACGWCGVHPSVTKLYATETCQACRDGGSQHRVRVSLQRWKRSAGR